MFLSLRDLWNGLSFTFMFWTSAYISYVLVLVSSFEGWICTIDRCWYRQLSPLSQAHNTCVCLQSAVVCAVCSSAAFWSRRCRRLLSPLVLWSLLGVSRPLCSLLHPTTRHPHCLRDTVGATAAWAQRKCCSFAVDWSHYSNFTVSALATYYVSYQLQNIIPCL